MIAGIITSIIDFFYTPFKKIMPISTFRYAACGAVNVVLDIGLFYIFYNFTFHKQVLHLGFLAFQPHVAAFICSFFITFPVGFLLSKYIVWTGSNLKSHIQLFRYFLVVLSNFFINYIFLKLFVEYFHIYPTLSKAMTTIMVIVFSYVSQKHFTFKVKTESSEAEGANAYK